MSSLPWDRKMQHLRRDRTGQHLWSAESPGMGKANIQNLRAQRQLTRVAVSVQCSNTDVALGKRDVSGFPHAISSDEMNLSAKYGLDENARVRKTKYHARSGEHLQEAAAEIRKLNGERRNSKSGRIEP